MAKANVQAVEPAPTTDLGLAFAEVHSRLRSYLRRRVSNHAVAEDLLQDLFVKAMTAINTQRAPGNLVGWLYAAARTTVIDYYRANRTDQIELDEGLVAAESSNDEQSHQELATCLKPLVEKLPPLYRDTLLAIEFEGASLRSIAAAQGLSLSAIKSRASRGRMLLKEKLLACCQVEIANGLVQDYHPNTISSCGGLCE